MNLLKQACELKAAQDAAKPAKKLSLLEMIKAAYRAWKGKRAYEALKLAKRKEKADLVLSNTARADQLEKEADDLVMESVGTKDKAKIDELMDLATAKMIEASTLRQAI